MARAVLWGGRQAFPARDIQSQRRLRDGNESRLTDRIYRADQTLGSRLRISVKKKYSANIYLVLELNLEEN
jgi:hypothetical protein